MALLGIPLNPYQGLKLRQIPQSDVLIVLGIPLNPYQGLKQGCPEALDKTHVLGIPLNPYQGLKLKDETVKVIPNSAVLGIPLNPYQGLKLVRSSNSAMSGQCLKNCFSNSMITELTAEPRKLHSKVR